MSADVAGFHAVDVHSHLIQSSPTSSPLSDSSSCGKFFSYVLTLHIQFLWCSPLIQYKYLWLLIVNSRFSYLHNNALLFLILMVSPWILTIIISLFVQLMHINDWTQYAAIIPKTSIMTYMVKVNIGKVQAIAPWLWFMKTETCWSHYYSFLNVLTV